MKKSLLRLATATLVATATSTAFGGVTERLRRACKTPIIYAN